MNTQWKEMLPELLPEYEIVNGEKVFSERTKELMAIIENGIPKTQNPRDIVIIGAGISGMVAASLLASAGHKVTIFEANMRVGGADKNHTGAV